MVSERYAVLRHGGGGAPTTLICGAVRFDHPAAHRLVSLLPRMLYVEASMIYTTGNNEQRADETGCWQHLGLAESIVALIFGVPVERLASFDTHQFDDYSKVVADRFDPAHKANRRREVFPVDCRKARELGAKLLT